jgi:TRAP-type C4-dicarboxylate transport system substrate-binding protein
VTINNDAWNKISPANRTIVTDLAHALEPGFWAASAKADMDSSARLVAGGMQRVEIPSAMMAELRQRTAQIRADFIAQVPESAAPLKAYLAEMKRG